MNQSAKIGVVIAIIVALLAGGGIGYALSKGNSMESTQQTSITENGSVSQSASDLQVTLNNLLREHVSSSIDVTRAYASSAPQSEIDGALAAQTANAGDIAAAVGSIYGQEAQDSITTLFVDHIMASNNYAKAVASGDENAKMEAQKELDEYLTDISAFFSGAISTLPQDDVYALLSEHESLINQSTQAFKDGDFTKSYDLERQALTQVDGIAKALATGIVATQPDKF